MAASIADRSADSLQGRPKSIIGMAQLALLGSSSLGMDRSFRNEISTLTRETFLSFAPQKDSLSIWAADDRGMQFHLAALPLARIAGYAGELLALLRDPNSELRRVRVLAQRLHRALLAPLSGLLDSTRTLYFHFAGDMRRFPPGVLAEVGGDWLEEGFSTVDAADFPWRSGRRQATGISLSSKLLIIGAPHPLDRADDETLPAANEDLLLVAGAFPHNDMICQGAATREQFNRLAPQAEVVHCRAMMSGGAHGAQLHLAPSRRELGAPRHPDAGIVPLKAYRRRALAQCILGNLDVEHVSRRLGDSPDLWNGASQALHAAGVAHVVIPRWNVQPAVRRAFQRHFYESLPSGRPVEECVRLAVSRIRSTPGWQHPHFWATFAHSVSHL